MILAHIDSPTTYQPLAENKIWQQALQWIKSNAHNSPEGIYELRGKDMYVNVHSYSTLPEHLCRFESHKKYIDLQYCISGGERIAWQPISRLIKDGEYDKSKDFQFYKFDKPGNLLDILPGNFGIFYPEDAHMPMVYDGINQRVEKLVVKIITELLQ